MIRTTFLPILVFLRLLVVELWANMHQTDDMSFDLLTSPRMSVMRVIVLHLCTKFDVRRSPCSEDMAHYLSQH